jgi:uncharacterized protein YjbI with pentapeptide repeats
MSSREEIQITDLEPSIEGGEDIKYVVQIRGIDGTGRPGPWSEPLEFSSPQQIPSLESFNYVPGEQGWKLDNDGTFEVNDAFIRGELQSANYEEGVAGWRLKNTGDVEFSTGLFRGALQIGSNTFRVDSSGNLSIGGSSPSNAPFAVNTNGTITAMSISGSFIQANTITAAQIASNTITASQIASNTIRANEIRAGTITANEIASSTITGSNIAGGTITSTNIANATINGSLIAASTITGGNIANATITGAKIANATITGAKIQGGTITGALIENSTITNSNIASLDAAKINTGTLNADRISGIVIRPRSLIIDDSNGRLSVSASSLSTSLNSGLQVAGASNFSTTLFRNSGILARTGTNVIVTSNGTFGTGSSSIRYKENIRPVDKIDNILKIESVIFDFKQQDLNEERDDSNFNIYGAIAEQVDEIGVKELIYYDPDGIPLSIQYDKLGLALIPYVKELYDRIEELERRLDGN